MNVVLLTGNLGRDPEVSHGKGGARCSLRLAVDRSYMSGGKRKETTEWVDVVVWGKQGDTCARYLTKGRLVQVQGEIRTRSFEHKGQKRTATEVVADKVDFLDRPAGRKPEDLPEVASCDDGFGAPSAKTAPESVGTAQVAQMLETCSGILDKLTTSWQV